MQKSLKERERELKRKEAIWEKEKGIVEREQALNKSKRDMFKRAWPSTSKMLIIFLFLNCTLIELFTGFVVIKSIALAAVTGLAPDFSPLVALIGAVVGEVIGYAVYSLKSMKENTTGGIVFEKAMLQTIEEEVAPNDQPKEPDFEFINLDDNAVG